MDLELTAPYEEGEGGERQKPPTQEPPTQNEPTEDEPTDDEPTEDEAYGGQPTQHEANGQPTQQEANGQPTQHEANGEPTQHEANGEPFLGGTGSRLILHPEFHSEFLPDDRNVIVYLPPGYEREPHRSYPVLYMHDGQNLFDPETSFIRGRTWEIREHADRLILAGEIEPLIVVGVYNTPRRLEEYTHARDRRMGGGEADLYGRLLVYELKPWIDDQYRTRSGEQDTGLGGSSLGGLVSLYLGLRHAEIFGKLAIMSPSVWWNHKSIVGFLNEYDGPPWPRIWLDVGDNEGKRSRHDVDMLYNQLVVNGWLPEVNVHYQMVEGGTHDEAAWAARVGDMLRFLFPARR